jgi:hypothetical protein
MMAMWLPPVRVGGCVLKVAAAAQRIKCDGCWASSTAGLQAPRVRLAPCHAGIGAAIAATLTCVHATVTVGNWQQEH